LSDFQRGYFSSGSTKVYLKFKVDITVNYLWGVQRFSSYRKHLIDLIFNLIDEKLTYEQIANKLNSMNYKSLRDKKFTKGIIYGILNKQQIHKKKKSKHIYSDFKLYFLRV
tara:strand:+ start:48 stop:380 length:333 start_codon:yes stop_codon:yes gene_type:complete